MSRPVVAKVVLCGLAVLVGAAAAPAPEHAVRVAWSTYLRNGAGVRFAVVDELQHDQVVILGACAGGWCHVSDGQAEGFVDRDALDLPRTAAAVSASPADCVVAAQVGDRRPAPTRFCRAAP